ncbi:hypothetical protein SEPCBS57363_001548 [Sporothrix epigloea]|uniref:Queuine tRNA-ribosyltransferase accessory subunit 2 n=1 Tax=Sporothrix epigloea TaxID=1892477 RepID=A0ABP0DAV9_9PEZI
MAASMDGLHESATPSAPQANMPPPPLFRIFTTAASSIASTISTSNAVFTDEVIGRTAVPRLGSLALPGRKAVATPTFFAVTSRGAVPHVTPDNIARTNLVDGAYFALEDFVESIPLRPGRVPPIFSTPVSSNPDLALAPSSAPSLASSSSIPRLHAFSGLPSSTISVLAPRRYPAAASHLGNGPRHVSIVTSTGFQKLTLDAYHAALDSLRPDIAIPMADLTHDGGTVSHTASTSATSPPSSASTCASVPYPSAKRALRMATYSEDWIDKVHCDKLAETTGAALFAPTLPVPYATQWQYLNRLAELAASSSDEAPNSEPSQQMKPTIAGLAVYDVDLMQDLHANYAESLASLPRLSLHPAVTPHHVLRQVGLGIDVILLPAITDASEQGLAYTFSWAEAASLQWEAGSEQLPLAIDLSDPVYKADLCPLQPGCTCATCATHHRAYLHHLLDAREMLAWTLLQLHNHHVMTELFAGIRKTLAAAVNGGVAAFREQAQRFRTIYEPEMPVGQGTRPRLRGYQVKTNGVVEAPLNKPQWGRLQDPKLGATLAALTTLDGSHPVVLDA